MSALQDVSSCVNNLLTLCAAPTWTAERLSDIDRLLLQAVADVRQLRNECGVLTHAARYTALRAIPDDVLSHIFLQVQDQPEEDDPPEDRSWVTVLLVCRRWRRVALATAGLWRDIILEDMPSETTLAYIHRRRALPFFVWAHRPDWLSSISSSAPSFSQQVCRLIVNLDPGTDGLHCLDWLKPANLPNLEDLWLSLFVHDAHAVRDAIYLYGFVHLRLIDVNGFMPSWTSNPFPLSVQRLSLDTSGLPGSPTSSQLRDCLEPLSHLISFTIFADSLHLSPQVERLTLPAIEYIFVGLPYEDLHSAVLFLPLQCIRPYSFYLRGPRDRRRTNDAGLHSLFYDYLTSIIHPRPVPYTSIHISTSCNARNLLLRDCESRVLSLPADRSGPGIQRILDLKAFLDIKHVCIEDLLPKPSIVCRLTLHDLLPFLCNTTELTIQRRVGMESTAVLLGLSGSGGQFLFGSSEAYAVCWPNLSAITLKGLRYAVSGTDTDTATRKLGHLLWAIRSAAPHFRSLKIVRCIIDEQEVQRWSQFIPEVEMGLESDDE